MNIITATHINKSFVNKSKSANSAVNNVLKDISIEIEKGKITSLMGASGVGKSTLLYILGTLDKPDSGEISFNVDDKVYDYSKLNEKDFSVIRNKHIGFIFQFHHLLPEFTVLENIMMPGLLLGIPAKSVSAKATELMEQMDILGIRSQKPSELSGGEAQRAAISRALINSPELIFADEPTGNLDSQNTNNVINLLKKINSDTQITLLIATHSEQIAENSDRIIYMKDGQITN